MGNKPVMEIVEQLNNWHFEQVSKVKLKIKLQ